MNKLLTRGPVWELDIEQDADWLFAKVGGQNQELTSYLSLSDRLWAIFRQHPVKWLVLELDSVQVNSSLAMQLVLLHKWIGRQGGMMRLSGLPRCQQHLLETNTRCFHLRFAHYPNRESAVRADVRPSRPR